jgi:hypothetical protein
MNLQLPVHLFPEQIVQVGGVVEPDHLEMLQVFSFD